MGKMTGKRLFEVRDGIARIAAALDDDPDVVTYDDLEQEDQDTCMLVAVGLIKVVDGLLGPYKPKKEN